MYIVYNIFIDNKLFIDNGKKVSKIFVIFDAIIRCNNFLLDTCYISKKDILSIYEINFTWNFTMSSKTVVGICKPWYTNSKWWIYGIICIIFWWKTIMNQKLMLSFM